MAGNPVVKSEKEDIISKVYYDRVYGFGSIEQTLKQALAQDPTIKREDVKRFLDKQEVRQKKKPLKQNSYVPFEAHDEVQMDIARSALSLRSSGDRRLFQDADCDSFEGQRPRNRGEDH